MLKWLVYLISLAVYIMCVCWRVHSLLVMSHSSAEERVDWPVSGVRSQYREGKTGEGGKRTIPGGGTTANTALSVVFLSHYCTI